MRKQFFFILLAIMAGVAPRQAGAKGGVASIAASGPERPCRTLALDSRQVSQPDMLADCDTLLLTDGAMKLIHFRRLTETEIIYCECGATGECEQRISRSESRQLRLSSGIQIEPALAPQAEAGPVSPPPVNGRPGKDQRVLEPMALISLIGLGLSLILTAALFGPVFLLWGPVGLVLGILSFRRIRRYPEQYKGKGLAILAIVLGAINVAIGLLIFIWIITFFAIFL